MANKIDIEIGAIDSASGVLENIFSAIKGGVSAFDLIAVSAMAAANFVRDSTQEAFDYDQQIKSLMITTGGTAEATSRLVQTLDDAGIGYDTVTKAMKEMSKDGTEPNIQELARLSDEFKSLNTGAEKGKFLLDNFGKSGESMARAMEMGGDSLLRMYSEMEGGLIITQKAIDEAEKYRTNIDELNDSWTSVKITLGNEVIPVINDTIPVMQNTSAAIQEQSHWWEYIIPPIAAAHTAYLLVNSALGQNKIELIAAADAVAAHGDALDGAVTSTSSLGAATALTTQEINDMTKANNEQMSLIKKLDSIQKDYNTSLAEMTAEFGAGSQEVKTLQADHQAAMNSIAYDLYLARLAVDGFTEAERIAAEQAGVSMGVFSQEAVDLSYQLIDNADKVGDFGQKAKSSFMSAKESAMDAKSEAVAYGQAIAEASVDREVTVTFHGVTTGDGWDPTYDVGHIGDGGRGASRGAMSSPYAAQQTTQTIDYQMFAVVLRDVLSQFFK